MRFLNRVATSVLAVALIAAGLLAAVEAILVASGRPPWLLPLGRWHATLTSATYADPVVRGVAIVLVVLGLLILVAQLRPWPPDQLSVGGGGGARWRVRRRSVEHRVADAVRHVNGVNAAAASVRGSQDHWRVRVRALARPEQLPEAQRAARAELDRLSAPADVGLRLELRPPRRVL